MERRRSRSRREGGRTRGERRRGTGRAIGLDWRPSGGPPSPPEGTKTGLLLHAETGMQAGIRPALCALSRPLSLSRAARLFFTRYHRSQCSGSGESEDVLAEQGSQQASKQDQDQGPEQEQDPGKQRGKAGQTQACLPEQQRRRPRDGRACVRACGRALAWRRRTTTARSRPITRPGPGERPRTRPSACLARALARICRRCRRRGACMLGVRPRSERRRGLTRAGSSSSVARHRQAARAPAARRPSSCVDAGAGVDGDVWAWASHRGGRAAGQGRAGQGLGAQKQRAQRCMGGMKTRRGHGGMVLGPLRPLRPLLSGKCPAWLLLPVTCRPFCRAALRNSPPPPPLAYARLDVSAHAHTPTHPQLLLPHTPSPSHHANHKRTPPPSLAMSERGAFRGRGGGRGAGSADRGGARGGGRGGAAAAAGGGHHGAGGASGERPKKENILDLTKYMGKDITVKFSGGREGA